MRSIAHDLAAAHAAVLAFLAATTTLPGWLLPLFAIPAAIVAATGVSLAIATARNP